VAHCVIEFITASRHSALQPLGILLLQINLLLSLISYCGVGAAATFGRLKVQHRYGEVKPELNFAASLMIFYLSKLVFEAATRVSIEQ